MPRHHPIRWLWKEQGPLLVLILVICLAHVPQMFYDNEVFMRFEVVPAEVVSSWSALRAGDFKSVSAGEFATLLSHAFLHGDVDHLLGNMLFLWIFAALAAELIGHRWMLAVFAISAISGGIVHGLLNRDDIVPMLGASGAVTGFEGLYLGMAARWHLPHPHVWPMSRPVPPANLAILAGLNYFLDFSGYISGPSGIAHGAHLGGFIAGMALGGFIVPMPRLAMRR
jgi:membrane associated rhomboid family serine protease